MGGKTSRNRERLSRSVLQDPAAGNEPAGKPIQVPREAGTETRTADIRQKVDCSAESHAPGYLRLEWDFDTFSFLGFFAPRIGCGQGGIRRRSPPGFRSGRER